MGGARKSQPDDRDVLPADHPGVFVPPLLIYIVPFGVGILLNRLKAWSLVASGLTPAVETVAILLVLAGVAVALSGVIALRRAGTTILPVGTTRTMVGAGIYRVSRNPMYVGMVPVYAGSAMLLNTAWPLALLPGVIVIIDRYAIRREERYLEAKFGEAYRRYCATVRRWV